jgi:hypothetical protein
MSALGTAMKVTHLPNQKMYSFHLIQVRTPKNEPNIRAYRLFWQVKQESKFTARTTFPLCWATNKNNNNSLSNHSWLFTTFSICCTHYHPFSTKELRFKHSSLLFRVEFILKDSHWWRLGGTEATLLLLWSRQNTSLITALLQIRLSTKNVEHVLHKSAQTLLPSKWSVIDTKLEAGLSAGKVWTWRQSWKTCPWQEHNSCRQPIACHVSEQRRAMAQAVSCLPLTAEAVCDGISQCGICGGQGDIGTTSFRGLQFPMSVSFHHISPYPYITWGMKNKPVEGRSSETILSHRHEQELTEHLGCDGEQVFHDICNTLPMKCEGFGSLISEAVCVSVCEREREVVYACDLPLCLYTHGCTTEAWIGRIPREWK